jgi:tetrahydromethanopterin S-methyltransferase subunit G
MWENLGPIVTGVIFVFNLAIAGAAAGIAMVVHKAIAAARKDIDGRLDEIDEKIDDKINRQAREFGETVAAIRQKMQDVEIWGRDNYVKKDSFALVTDRISREVKDFGDRIDKRLERMEEKIDSKT